MRRLLAHREQALRARPGRYAPPGRPSLLLRPLGRPGKLRGREAAWSSPRCLVVALPWWRGRPQGLRPRTPGPLSGAAAILCRRDGRCTLARSIGDQHPDHPAARPSPSDAFGSLATGSSARSHGVSTDRGSTDQGGGWAGARGWGRAGATVRVCPGQRPGPSMCNRCNRRLSSFQSCLLVWIGRPCGYSGYRLGFLADRIGPTTLRGWGRCCVRSRPWVGRQQPPGAGPGAAGMRGRVVATTDDEAEAWELARRLAEELVRTGEARRFGVRPEQRAGAWWVLLVPRADASRSPEDRE